MARLIVAFDGTGNRPETALHREVTNVSRIVRSIRPIAADGIRQAIEYVRGIGTGHFLDRFLGGATGEGISSNIEQGYHFIANNYSRGDDIYMFGFSRGAYTAMSLSGFLNHVGILRKSELHHFPEAYEMYKATAAADMHQVRSRYEQPQESYATPIRFLGLWDAVGHLAAVPMLTEKHVRYHEVDLTANVSHAYHALAVHEIRIDFSPTLWKTYAGGTVIQQVWFPGCHSDVGGTYAEPGLSNLTLHWMVDRARALGLDFDDRFLASMSPDPAAKIHCSVTSTWKWRSTQARDIDPSNGLKQFVHPSVSSRLGSNPGRKRAAPDYALAEKRACALPAAPLTAQEHARHQQRLVDAENARQHAMAIQRINALRKLERPTLISKPSAAGQGKKGARDEPPKPGG